MSFGFIIASVLDADVGGSDQELHESEDQLRLLVGRHHARAPEEAGDSAGSSREIAVTVASSTPSRGDRSDEA